MPSVRPMRSPTLLLIRMNAAETNASRAIADCTPLTVVSRSATTAEIETFISDVSKTSTNIAAASNSPSRETDASDSPTPVCAAVVTGLYFRSRCSILPRSSLSGWDRTTPGRVVLTRVVSARERTLNRRVTRAAERRDRRRSGRPGPAARRSRATRPRLARHPTRRDRGPAVPGEARPAGTPYAGPAPQQAIGRRSRRPPHRGRAVPIARTAPARATKSAPIPGIAGCAVSVEVSVIVETTRDHRDADGRPLEARHDRFVATEHVDVASIADIPLSSLPTAADRLGGLGDQSLANRASGPPPLCGLVRGPRVAGARSPSSRARHRGWPTGAPGSGGRPPGVTQAGPARRRFRLQRR